MKLIVRVLCAIGLCLCLVGCAAVAVNMGAPAPDFYSVSASANYKPVSVPGSQRRVAQSEAESVARRKIYEYVGSMPVGNETVNDVIARDNRLRAKVLEIVRNSETVEWSVDPACGAVTVQVRVDLNKVREAVAACR